ncbi:myb-like protein Z [Schistocerca cancellata]|uniref:myb-like protein Z n=1 Tax=Schistocerca cancellata TaxID=274614 RepID=UPI0021181A29|nr:myb-like protein Z [Schistocerca cancellata]
MICKILNSTDKSHPSQFRDERNNNWTRQGYSHNTNRDQNRHHPYHNRWQSSNSCRERSLFHSNEYDRDYQRNRQYGNKNNYYQERQNNFRRNSSAHSYDSRRNSPPHDRQTRNYVNYQQNDRPEFHQNWRDSNRAEHFQQREFVEVRSPNPNNDARTKKQTMTRTAGCHVRRMAQGKIT